MGEVEPGGPRRHRHDAGELTERMDAARPELTVEDLERWEEHGATWRAIELSDQRAVVELCTCYGEPVDTLQSDAPALIAFLRSRREQH